ncbi:MAG: FixH family protein, partial [Actinomycetota bacterium]|nr:FixH family protein [Actinomycetota bacterium]
MSRWWQVLVVVAVAALAFGGGLLFFSGGDDETPAGRAGFFTPAPARSAAPPDVAALAAQAAERGCAARALRDPAYNVAVETEPEPPRVEGTTFRLRVTRDGSPVEGARVCL